MFLTHLLFFLFCFLFSLCFKFKKPSLISSLKLWPALMEKYCVKFLVLKSTEWYSFAFLETIMECFKTNLLKKKKDFLSK